VVFERISSIKPGTDEGGSNGKPCISLKPGASPLTELQAGVSSNEWTRMALPSRTVAVAALASLLMASVAPASSQTPGAVYVFHSDEVGDCPSLEWSIVVGGNSTLSGIIAWNSMKKMARVFGTVAADKSFHMDATDVSGGGKTVAIDGRLMENGWLTAAIKGPGLDCQNIKVPMYRQVSE
jgi:hypothetical protein